MIISLLKLLLIVENNKLIDQLFQHYRGKDEQKKLHQLVL